MIYQAKYISELLSQFNNLFKNCKVLINPLTKTQLNYSIDDENWTIAQILDHLTIVNTSYLLRSERVLSNLSVKKSDKPIKFKSEYYGNLYINLIGDSRSIKTKTITDFLPEVDFYEENIKLQFCETLKLIGRFIEKIRDFNLNEGKVKFVNDNFIKVNIGDVAKIILVHIERHLDQIKELLVHKSFPKA